MHYFHTQKIVNLFFSLANKQNNFVLYFSTLLAALCCLLTLSQLRQREVETRNKVRLKLCQEKVKFKIQRA